MQMAVISTWACPLMAKEKSIPTPCSSIIQSMITPYKATAAGELLMTKHPCSAQRLLLVGHKSFLLPYPLLSKEKYKCNTQYDTVLTTLCYSARSFVAFDISSITNKEYYREKSF